MNEQILSCNIAKDYAQIVALAKNMEASRCTSGDIAQIIGKAYEKQQAFSTALIWYQRSLQLEPMDETLGMIMGVYLALHRYEEAKSFLAGLTTGQEEYYYQAACYELALRMGADEEDQIAALEAFLDIQSEETYMLRLAMLYIQTGQEKEAKKLCKKIVRLFISGEAVEYAEALLDALKEEKGAEFIVKKPWLKDAVFKHVSFDLSQPPVQDVVPVTGKPLQEPVKKPLEPITSTGEKIGEKKPKEAKKDKISPIIEKSLKNVVGMENLRVLMNNILNILQAEKKRVEFDSIFQNNIMILGPAGCGKTTAAYAAAKALCNIGIISREEPVVAEYDRLVGDKPEDTHENIKALFEQAENGCILIDNIHDFDNTGMYSQGLEVLDQLVKAYQAAEGSIPFIITGSEAEVNALFDKRKRLSELFNLPRIVLGKYTNEELVQIADKIAESKGLVIDEAAMSLLKQKLEHMLSQPDFMYSRDLERMINDAYMHLINRISAKRRPSEKEYYVILEEDLGPAETAETVEELLAELDGMTGLAEVKTQVHKIVNHVSVQKMQKAYNIKQSGHGTLHLLFTGNAGTGKTTVARIIGRIYKRLGVLSTGQLVECTRRDLVSQYVGATAPLVQQKVKEAMGGILFIDEAYTLCRDDNDTFGKEAIEALLTDIENHRDNLMVILAGYSVEMERFMDQNQGLRSRIPTEIRFEDYSVEEMTQIFLQNIRKEGKILDVGLEEEVRRLIEVQSGKKDFGNARGIRNMTNAVILNMENRIGEADPALISKNDFLIIRREDLEIAEEKQASTKTVQEYLEDLNALTGLASVKAQVNTIVASVSMNKRRQDMGMSVGGYGTLHMIFKGNAGTGKTTVARIIGNIYRELGVLRTGQLVECGRSDLVAGYSGQTALKTKAKVQEALGGVLFIDEAYALAGDAFGKEAIDTLVADIENYRNDLMVIIAGYSGDMDTFLKENQGLSSRFPNEIMFEDYTPEEMLSIMKHMLAANQLVVADSLTPLLLQLIAKYSMDADFGNARGIRNLTQKLMENQNVRLYRMELAGVPMSKEDYKVITEEDITPLL